MAIKQGPTINTRRTKVELHRASVRMWSAGIPKAIEKELIWIAKTTLDDLEAAQKEIKNLRAKVKI